MDGMMFLHGRILFDAALLLQHECLLFHCYAWVLRNQDVSQWVELFEVQLEE